MTRRVVSFRKPGGASPETAPKADSSLYRASPQAREWLSNVQGSLELTPLAKVIATVIVCQEAAPDGTARWCLPKFCEALGMSACEVLGGFADLTYGRWLDTQDSRWVLQNGSGQYHGLHP